MLECAMVECIMVCDVRMRALCVMLESVMVLDVRMCVGV